MCDTVSCLVPKASRFLNRYWVCKRAPGVAYEAMECWGGNGYVEDGPMARLYRQAPLNAIWEGSGNVICLDVLRAMQIEPDSVEVLRKELHSARGKDARYDLHLSRVDDVISSFQRDARWQGHPRRPTKHYAPQKPHKPMQSETGKFHKSNHEFAILCQPTSPRSHVGQEEI